MAKKKRRRRRRLIVSDHARVRYLQRVEGLDIRELDKLILTDSVREQHKAFGNGRYPLGDGACAIVNNNTVVSVWKRRQRRAKP